MTRGKSLLGAGLCICSKSLLIRASFSLASPLLTETRTSHWPESDSPSLPPKPHSCAGSRSEPSGELLGSSCQWAQLAPSGFPPGFWVFPQRVYTQSAPRNGQRPGQWRGGLQGDPISLGGYQSQSVSKPLGAERKPSSCNKADTFTSTCLSPRASLEWSQT